MHNAKERLTFVAAEVREPFPASIQEAGVDTLVMKHFLSGFSDSDADVILKHCKQIMPAQGKILLLQTLVPEAGDRHHNVCKDGVAPGESHRRQSRGAFNGQGDTQCVRSGLGTLHNVTGLCTNWYYRHPYPVHRCQYCFRGTFVRPRMNNMWGQDRHWMQVLMCWVYRRALLN